MTEATEETVEFREDEWKIRPCEVYKDEYGECTSFKARFQQYFIYGTTVDCAQWNRDYESCQKWHDSKNEAAYNDLIKSENQRRYNRLKPHYANDVWKKRSAPPADWNKPVPEWMQKEHAASFLGIKANELKDNVGQNKRYMCSIS